MLYENQIGIVFTLMFLNLKSVLTFSLVHLNESTTAIPIEEVLCESLILYKSQMENEK
jgi:hypothetical protein